jgi:hypothetical protein
MTPLTSRTRSPALTVRDGKEGEKYCLSLKPMLTLMFLSNTSEDTFPVLVK